MTAPENPEFVVMRHDELGAESEIPRSAVEIYESQGWHLVDPDVDVDAPADSAPTSALVPPASAGETPAAPAETTTPEV